MKAKTGVGARIRQARRAKDLTQTALGDLIGVDQSRVAEWEREQHTPSGDNLRRLAAALGATPDQLLDGPPPEIGGGLNPHQIALDALELSGRLNLFAQALLGAQGQPPRAATPAGTLSLRKAREGKR